LPCFSTNGVQHRVQILDRTFTRINPARSIRGHGVGVLVVIDHSQRSSFLITALQDKDAAIRTGAAYAVSTVKDSAAIEPLHTAQHDTNAEVRQQATEAVSGTGSDSLDLASQYTAPPNDGRDARESGHIKGLISPV
jgi:hypothetical protein